MAKTSTKRKSGTAPPAPPASTTESKKAAPTTKSTTSADSQKQVSVTPKKAGKPNTTKSSAASVKSQLSSSSQKTKQTPSKKRRHSEVDETPSKKEQAKIEAAFKKQEEEWDKLVPEQYRKYRPVGYPLYLPEDTNQNFRVYCDGIYDLFHLGHMNQLKQCKEMFPNVTLVVGVPADEVTWKNKGLTVLTDKQRCDTLLHCKWVDEVIPDSPWCLNTKFLEEHNIDYVAHDDIPYASADSDDVYAPVKKLGKFLVTQRTEGISTSDIITKIIRDYDKYLLRNFARGASRHDLNVSWFKKNELEIKKHIGDFRQYWKKTNESLNNTSKDLYYEVREYLRASSSALKRINSSPSLSNLDTLTSSRSPSPTLEPLSPAAEFAMKYSGNRNNQPRSIISSFKKWVFKKDSEDSELSHDEKARDTESDATQTEELEIKPQRKKQKL